MSAFWSLFWIGFIVLPMMVLLGFWIYNQSDHSGAQKVTSHYWASPRSGHKMRDATVRDVWEKTNKRSWWDHQKSVKNSHAAFLIIIALVTLFLLATNLDFFALPKNDQRLALFWGIGAPILGGAAAGVLFRVQRYLSKYRIGFFRFLHILSLVVAGVAILGALVLTFAGIGLPISHHYLWAPLAMTAVLPLLDKAFGRVKKTTQKIQQKKAVKSGTTLDRWTFAIETELIGKMDSRFRYTEITESMLDHRKSMQLIQEKLSDGIFDKLIKDSDFFKLTENLLVYLVQGKQVGIESEKIYFAREDVIRTLQAVYFYAINNTRKFGYQMHPVIEKAARK